MKLPDPTSQRVHSTGRNLRDTLDQLPWLVRAFLSYQRQQAVSRQATWLPRSPRRSKALTASSRSPRGIMTRVAVSCYIPTPRNWGCLQKNWRCVATHALGQVLALQSSGVCFILCKTVAGFILSTKGPYKTIRKTF